ncbi:unnamed protein product [Linum tenue]|uniref:Major facilitator superfamily (MFS) profile domain-containing protein n=1 Tax=Linum tenue TaxID=586396 RepID=A0AAV0JCH6_9ROSI|nr:unnamed protein product [Linum tenue]
MGMFKKQQKEEREETEQPLLLPPSSSSSSSSSSSQDHVGDRDSTLTPTFLLSILAVACGCFATGCTIGYTSPVEYQIIGELGLSVDEYSVFGSMMVVGGLAGSLVGGKITELSGRRRVRMITTLNCHTMMGLDGLFIGGWLTIASAKGAPQLYFGMLLIGMAAPINLYLAPIYVAEITPSNLRGTVVSVTQLIMFCSISFAYLLGSLINWRALALIGAIPCLVQLLLTMFIIPESPRWLAKTGKKKEFEAALLQLRGGNADISWEVDEIKEYIETINSISSKDSSFLDMFQRQYAIPLIVGNGLLVLQQFSGMNSYNMYTDVIFVSAGIPSTAGFLAVASFQIVGAFLAATMMDRYGRRPLLQAGVIGTCLGSLLTTLSFILQGFEGWSRMTPTLALLSVMIYEGAIAVWSGIPWMIVAEWNPPGASAVAIGFAVKLVPETRGKTLEEIQSSFTHKMGMTKKQEREETSCSNGEEGRTQAQQPLLLPPSQGHDGGGRDSPLTPTFLLSILAVACGSFSAGCTIGYTSPVEYQIIEELGLSVDEGALQLDLGMLLIGTGASINIYLLACLGYDRYQPSYKNCIEVFGIMVLVFLFPPFMLVNYFSGATPCFVQLLLAIFFIPESPRWLAKTGKEKEFEAALLQLRGGNVDISWEVDEIKVGNGLLLLQQFSGMNSYAMYTAAIFVSAGIPSTVGFLAVASFQLVATFMAAALMDRYGRRPLLQVGVIGTCLGSLLTALSFILQIFPLNIKGSAGTMCCLSSSISGLMVSVSFQSLLRWSPLGTFLMYASVSAVAIGFVAKLVPETRGKTLEEIQSSFSRE